MNKSIVRLLRRKGQTWGLRTWTESTETAYNRKRQSLGVATDFTAIRVEDPKPLDSLSARGRTREVEVQLFVRDTLDVSAVEDDTQKNPVAVSPSGVEYDIVHVGREGEIHGYYRLFLSKRRAS